MFNKNDMYAFPEDYKKIRTRIRSYERKLEKEKEEFGCYDDGSGKRYLLGPLYLLMEDIEGAIKSFKWFETTFSDDTGDPYQYLCWTLALYKNNDLKAAKKKALQTLFQNLYLIPHLLHIEQEELDIWYSSNLEYMEYAEYIPPEFIDLWDEDALKWLRRFYNDEIIQDILQEYIALNAKLNGVPVGNERSELLKRIYALKDSGVNSI